jgi:hypothetical protein
VNRKGTVLLGGIAVLLLLLAFSFWKSRFREQNPPTPTVVFPPTPMVTASRISSPEVSASSSPTLQVSSFDRSDNPNAEEIRALLSPNRAAFASKGYVSVTDGLDIIRFPIPEGTVYELSVSPDGRYIAFLRYTRGWTMKKPEPVTGLSVIDLRTNESVEVSPLSIQFIEYPVWSEDGRSLSWWVDSGSASVLFDMAERKPVMKIAAGDSSAGVSPILFIPASENPAIAFVQNGELMESDYDGNHRTVITKEVMAKHPVHEAPDRPNPPFYSPDGIYIGYFLQNGDLLVMNRKTGDVHKILPGMYSNMFEAMSVRGSLYGFTAGDNLLFDDLGDGYGYNTAPPVYLYSAVRRTKYLVPIPIPFSLDFASITISPDGRKFVIDGKGQLIFSGEGTLQVQCPDTDFRYPYNNWAGKVFSPVWQVWSDDGKFLLSRAENRLSFLETDICQEKVLLDESHGLASWIP